MLQQTAAFHTLARALLILLSVLGSGGETLLRSHQRSSTSADLLRPGINAEIGAFYLEAPCEVFRAAQRVQNWGV